MCSVTPSQPTTAIGFIQYSSLIKLLWRYKHFKYKLPSYKLSSVSIVLHSLYCRTPAGPGAFSTLYCFE